MPYIPEDKRVSLQKTVKILNLELQLLEDLSAGDLNYVLTSAVQAYVRAKGNLSYQLINDVLGALEGCKLELYRRQAAPYENKKIIDNGDVYTREEDK